MEISKLFMQLFHNVVSLFLMGECVKVHFLTISGGLTDIVMLEDYCCSFIFTKCF